MNYQLASAVDFAADEYFIQWVKAPDAAGDTFWLGWLAQNPSKREEVEQARKLVVLLSGHQPGYQPAGVDEVWQRLQRAMQEEQDGEPMEEVVVPISWWSGNLSRSIAAAVALLLVGAATVFLMRQAPVSYTTGYGEKLSVLLPDSSRVVLNGNSSITYSNHWPGFSARRVYLRGEAFFDVAHKGADQKFVVHTADEAAVEVLGTEFNVKSRNNGSKVMLASGKVQLSFQQKGQEQLVVMQPGELVEVLKTEGMITRERVSPELYIAWKDDKVIFDNTSLQEIANMLEQVYGYQVVIEDAELARQKLTASLNEQGVDKILATVSATLGARITKQEELKTILISNI
ncbi:FecR family protein [Pontibacter flavimaris]|uniref:DUF4974 domain-containing protein n=1 Tax=Pontibacter flavimaris TaxID=1797110 RepID=A0A1Q5PDT4_9BACT|nr:FecR domain-containing protein [Pontibacter flavimaris]OKL40343.1 hypothetical protein A3841_18660 [Pontibacter flavimaris]